MMHREEKNGEKPRRDLLTQIKYTEHDIVKHVIKVLNAKDIKELSDIVMTVKNEMLQSKLGSREPTLYALR